MSRSCNLKCFFPSMLFPFSYNLDNIFKIVTNRKHTSRTRYNNKQINTSNSISVQLWRHQWCNLWNSQLKKTFVEKKNEPWWWRTQDSPHSNFKSWRGNDAAGQSDWKCLCKVTCSERNRKISKIRCQKIDGYWANQIGKIGCQLSTSQF